MTSRRSGRRIWVNQFITTTVTMAALTQIDLLEHADQALKANSTVLGVRLSGVASMVAPGTAAFSLMHAGIVTGASTLDTVDQPDPSVDTDEASWLWHRTTGLAAAAFTDAGAWQPAIYFEDQVRAMRRIRDSRQTLWWIHKGTAVTGSVNIEPRIFVRTLLWVP